MYFAESIELHFLLSSRHRCAVGPGPAAAGLAVGVAVDIDVGISAGLAACSAGWTLQCCVSDAVKRYR